VSACGDVSEAGWACTLPAGHGGAWHRYAYEGTGHGDDKYVRWPVEADGPSGSAEDFVRWLGETHRAVSHRGAMAVEFHPSTPGEARALLEAYRASVGPADGGRVEVRTVYATRFYGGPLDGKTVDLTALPPRAEFLGTLYARLDDPDTGAPLGAYVAESGASGLPSVGARVRTHGTGLRGEVVAHDARPGLRVRWEDGTTTRVLPGRVEVLP
jgi:hypothetical protein